MEILNFLFWVTLENLHGNMVKNGADSTLSATKKYRHPKQSQWELRGLGHSLHWLPRWLWRSQECVQGLGKELLHENIDIGKHFYISTLCV